ncbi:hypothetical protein AB1L30_18060 [Bremerella sp. JC817]|uniref:hypothetical protein n=1 Tax=Bremerella sp. JC817 TaxID=3231756 RepID=UPI00345A5C7C
MRQLAFYLAVIISVGCHYQANMEPQGVAKMTKPEETTDLSSHGLPLLMDLPKNSEFRVPGQADLEIVSGQQFQLIIANGHFDLAEVKERQTGPKSFVEYLDTEIDEPNRFVVHGRVACPNFLYQAL